MLSRFLALGDRNKLNFRDCELASTPWLTGSGGSVIGDDNKIQLFNTLLEGFYRVPWERDGKGGGLYTQGVRNFVGVYQSRIFANQAEYFGAHMFIQGNHSTVEFVDSKMNYGVSYSMAGGIMVSGSHSKVSFVRFHEEEDIAPHPIGCIPPCDVGRCGGSLIEGDSNTLIVQNSTWSINVAFELGGALCMNGNNNIIQVENTTALDNTGIRGNGGFLSIQGRNITLTYHKGALNANLVMPLPEHLLN